MLALQSNDSWILHLLRNVLIVSISIILLPFSAFITIIAFALQQVRIVRPPRRSLMKENFCEPRVLITGVGMTKGLVLARTMYLGGCEVFGAGFKEPGNVSCGKFSRSISKFFNLQDPKCHGTQAYISQVVEIILSEQIDLWISCSGVATAVEDARLAHAIQEKTKCKAFQFDEQSITALDDKLKFMKKTSELQLARMNWYSLSGPKDVCGVLQLIKDSGAGVRFMIKSANMDDSTRGSLPLIGPQNLDVAEQVLRSLDYGKGQRWILQEFIEGGEEYCTQAVIVNGKVRAFTACPSASVLMHYHQLDVNSILYQEMLKFTQDYAISLGNNPTGHLSFDFLIRYTPSDGGFCGSIVPIECNPRCHTAIVLFEGIEIQLAVRYLEALNGNERGEILQPKLQSRGGFYWAAHDVVVLGFASVLDLLLASDQSRLAAIHQLLECVLHISTWRDPVFVWWDPLPWLALNHLYWPWKLVLASWYGARWRQLNVSTGKMFPI